MSLIQRIGVVFLVGAAFLPWESGAHQAVWFAIGACLFVFGVHDGESEGSPADSEIAVDKGDW